MTNMGPLFSNEMRLHTHLNKGDTVQAHLELMDYDGRSLWKGDIDFTPVWRDDGRMYLQNCDKEAIVSREAALRRLQEKTTRRSYEDIYKQFVFGPAKKSDATKEKRMACPICQERLVRSEDIRTYKKDGCVKKAKLVKLYACGTRQTFGELESEKPRIKVGKDCAAL